MGTSPEDTAEDDAIDFPQPAGSMSRLSAPIEAADILARQAAERKSSPPISSKDKEKDERRKNKVNGEERKGDDKGSKEKKKPKEPRQEKSGSISSGASKVRDSPKAIERQISGAVDRQISGLGGAGGVTIPAEKILARMTHSEL